MRAIYIACLLLAGSFTGFAQYNYLSGKTAVQRGAQEVYTVHFINPAPQVGDIYWVVVGGTVVYSYGNTCLVQWNNVSGTGFIEADDNETIQWVSLDIQIGDPVPVIDNPTQYYEYGISPTFTTSFNFPPTVPIGYQWQEWNPQNASWVNLNETSSTFDAPPLDKKYRCLVNVNGTVYALEAEAKLTSLWPGSINYASYSYGVSYSVLYNSPVTGIINYPANGGHCFPGSYSYVWEMSTENGPWVQFGTGMDAPATPPIIGRTRIRRSVLCDNELKYTNVLTFDAAYTSVDFENRNYTREIRVTKKGIRTWQEADQLPVRDKLQTTTYTDGLGRPVQSVNKGISQTPAGTWNDLVKHYAYDAAGRTLKDFLPYSSGTNLGRFKTDAENEQKSVVQSLYGEPATAATYSLSETDESPLNRIVKVRRPGQGWAGTSVSTDLDFNSFTENVRIWNLDYVVGSVPVSPGAYGDGTLIKSITTDEKGKKTITHTDLNGRVILTKVQLKEAGAELTAQHSGWICTYSVYDDLGRLCFQLQPEAVKYLDEHNWSFAAPDGQKVINELCFQYRYDEKGRNTWKKAPGAKPLVMIYDIRDRAVFLQDGNQRGKSPGEWTATLYDELDRPLITTLYNTSKTVSSLQDDVNNAPASNSTVSTPHSGIAVAAYQNPISNTDINNPAVCTILKCQFYDRYNFAVAKPFDANVDNTTAYSNSDPNVRLIVASDRTTGFATGSAVRVLGTTQFLTSTTYYDDDGFPVQTTEDNIKGGTDAVTLQYHFDGRVLSTYTKHTAAGTGYTGFGVLTKNNYDRTGKVTSIEKRWGGNGFKMIAGHSYDEMGRLKTKRLHPGYTGSGKNELESLTYSYNIHNNITGINKDYALKTLGSYDKWANFFGLYLGYDNSDGVFANATLNGRVSGLLWNTQGDDAQRKYDYSYDNAGRISKAVFAERRRPNDNWNNAKIDFSVKGEGVGETIQYDLNGNLLSMIQKSVLLTHTAAVEIDHLQYSYDAFSNRLLKVNDLANTGADNGRAGDFKPAGNASLNYDYDDNGNLTVDPNKGDLSATSPGAQITYNYLDKPVMITVPGKGTVQMVYDADGTKLQKTFTPVSGNPVTTTYINGYVYQGNDLQYIGFEEGRIRVMDYVSQTNGYDFVNVAGNIGLPNGKQGTFDFYLRDYQQNVRMILTEETHVGQNSCTMETARAAGEEGIFQSKTGNEVAASRFAVANIPGQSVGDGWQHPDIGSQVSRLGNLAAGKIGPNALLKVMAGDEITTTAIYYYQNPVYPGRGTTLLNDVVGSLIQAILGSPVTPTLTKDGTQNISTNLGGYFPFAQAVAPDADNDAGNAPKAYLNVLFFNERFEFVEEGSTAVRVEHEGANTLPLLLQNIRAPKNGYCYVYLSNESDEMVYFDNLRVQHTRGRIIEEDHYYAYGLKIQALSSQKAGDAAEGHLDNQHLYNGKELIDDADLGWYDYGFRNYDPQIGRFPQLDPLTDDYPYLTPYQYASCDPITNIDVDGLEGASSNSGRLSGAMLPEVRITSSRAASMARIAANGGPFTNLAQLARLQPVFHAIKQYIYTNTNATHTATQLYEAPAGYQPIAGSYSDSYGDWRLQETRNSAYYTYESFSGPEFKQGYFATSGKVAEKIDPGAYLAHRWAAERSEGRVINSFPVLGSGFLGIRRMGQGNITGGLSAIKDGSVEAATWLLPGAKLVPVAGGRVFWAGGEEVMNAAMNFAKENGMITMEMTRAGRNLAKLTEGMPWDQASKMWDRLSAVYAKGAAGPVHVFQNATAGVRINSTWARVEYPILKARNIVFHNTFIP